MSWRGERQRHGLAARGIETKNQVSFSKYKTQYKFLTPEQKKDVDYMTEGTYLLLKPEEHGIMSLYNLIKKKKGKDLAEAFFALISGERPLNAFDKRTLNKLVNILNNFEEFRLASEINSYVNEEW